MRSPVFLLVFLLAIVFSSVAFEQKRFIIGAYSEPPAFDDIVEAETYEQMAQAGFNMVLLLFFNNYFSLFQKFFSHPVNSLLLSHIVLLSYCEMLQ